MSNRTERTLEIPPHSIEFERAVIGSMVYSGELGNSTTTEFALRELDAINFYSTANQLIFKAIKSIHDSEQPVTLHTVVDKLKRDDKLDAVGGPGYIAGCDCFFVVPSNIPYYCKKVKDYAINRQLLEQVEGVKERIVLGLDGDDLKEELLNQKEVIEKLYDSTDTGKDRWENLGSDEEMEELEEMLKSTAGGRALEPVPSYLERVNRLQRGGYIPSTMSLFIAATGKGKTNFSIAEVMQKVKADIPCAFFSTEATKGQFKERLIKQEIGYKDPEGSDKIPSEILVRIGGHLARIKKALNENLWFYFEPRLSVRKIEDALNNLKRNYNIEPVFVVIDHFTALFDDSRRFRSQTEEEIRMAKELGALAGSNKAAFLVNIQISKTGAMGERLWKKIELTLDDLKGAGTIAEKSQFAMALSHYTPEYIEKKHLDFPPLFNQDKDGNSNDYYVRLASVKSNEGGAHNVYPLVYDYNYRLIRPIAEYQELYRNAAREESRDEFNYE